MTQRRTVFFVSDGTGITAQMLGHSLLTQFEGVEFHQVTLPFVDSAEKAEECLARIEAEAANGNGQPVVFSTLVNQDVVTFLADCEAKGIKVERCPLYIRNWIDQEKCRNRRRRTQKRNMK